MKKILYYFVLILGVILLIHSCRTYHFRSVYTSANELIHETNQLNEKPYLKAHYKNGSVAIFDDNWTIDTLTYTINGEAVVYDTDRKIISEGTQSIFIDEVVLFETNTSLQHSETIRSTTLMVLGGANVAMGLYCLVNPKACFGSCPTFYTHPNDLFHYSNAEGFTNAILPSMEYADIDAINQQAISGETFSIYMRNEAQETHCVNEVNLMAVEFSKNEFIFHSPMDEFYLCNTPHPPKKASGDEGEITELFLQDYNERFSLADTEDLQSSEEILLEFDAIKGAKELGINVQFRQTLMTTYLFYSAIGYMGDEYSDLMTKMEMDPELQENFDATTDLLGGIDVYTLNENKWEFQGTFNEAGPIAINSQMIPIQVNDPSQPIQVKLVLNRGLWRIDHVALAEINRKVDAIELQPVHVIQDGKENAMALNTLLSKDKHLVSMPGNDFEIQYELPNCGSNYQLFIKSKGYYLEWNREDWLSNKDISMIHKMVLSPAKYLKEVAVDYKQYESEMESIFWGSRIDTKKVSYYDFLQTNVSTQN